MVPPLASPVIPRPAVQPVAIRSSDLTDEQIGEAIRKGVDYLLSQFDPHTHLLSDLPDDRRGISRGQDILCVYALMQCGQAIDDPRLNPREPLMRNMIAAMKSLPLGDYGYETYARGLRATALALYNRPEDRLVLQTDADALVKGSRGGGYSYSLNHKSPLRTLLRSWDNSNSQYGLLGVWSAAEAGVEVPQSYWEQIHRHWLLTQSLNGQWGYLDASNNGTYSMTCAGLASLFVCHDYLDAVRIVGNVGREPFTSPIARGLKWLEAGDNCLDIPVQFPGYALYGLERVGLASGFKYLGHHDWYRELARQCIVTQQSDGSWGDNIETPYNLLFLSRGRHPITMNKLRFDGYWANRPRDVANLTRFAAHQLERQLNWQVVSVKRPWTDWMDSPILYLASHAGVNLSAEDYDKIRFFVQNGGLLFTQADGDSAEFNAFAGKLARRLFPAYELTDLPPGHPLCSAMFKVRPTTPLKVVTNGSRILMLHSTVDLSKYWEIRDDKRTPYPFELGTNLFVYAAGRQEFRNRLLSTYIPPIEQPPSRTFRVARLSYAGNWDPEPAGWQRFSRWFQLQTGYGLDVVSVPIRNLRPGTAPIAHLTGTARYDLTEEEAASIKRYVQSGGVLLVDMCGGTGAFDKGLQTSLYFKEFADVPWQTISSSHPLLAGEMAGMEDLSKPRLRRFTIESLGRDVGLPEELHFGRGHILATPLDITTGLLGTGTWGILGYEPDYAQSLLKNAILWTLDGQHDGDRP